MPPRSGQLDEISQAIGRLEGKVDGIDSYVHEREHNIANLSQKVDGLGTRIAKDIAGVEGRIDAKLDAWKREVDARLRALEDAHVATTGQKNLVIWFLQSPLIGWIAAGVLAFVAWWKKSP